MKALKNLFLFLNVCLLSFLCFSSSVQAQDYPLPIRFSELQTELNQARQLWQAKRPADYIMSYEPSDTNNRHANTVTVVNHRLEEWFSTGSAYPILTVTEMFKEIQKSIDDKYPNTRATYDPTNGRPLSFTILGSKFQIRKVTIFGFIGVKGPLRCDGSVVNIVGTIGPDVIRLPHPLGKGLTVATFGGNDRIYTRTNSNSTFYTWATVCAGSGDDQIYGRHGPERLIGGPGNDLILGGGGDDWLEGGPGNDWIYGQAGQDMLVGGSGDDYLAGNSGSDNYRGGPGRNRCILDSNDTNRQLKIIKQCQ